MPKTKYPADHIHWRPVVSGNVASVGWDQGRHLYIEFQSGAIYLYDGVSYQRASACARAKSVGSYLARQIQPCFSAVKVV